MAVQQDLMYSRRILQRSELSARGEKERDGGEGVEEYLGKVG
jgi:hypothetical protein